MPATMPANWIRTTIREMEFNQEGYVPASAVLVDHRGEVYLAAQSLLNVEKGNLVDPVRVRRDDGGYHIWLRDCQARWVPQNLAIHSLAGALVPVDSIHR